MKKTVTYEFTEAKKAMLEKILPDNPCEGCHSSHWCCGCPDGRAYNDAVRGYKEAGIYDIALSLKRIHDLGKEIERCVQDIRAENGKLPDTLRVPVPELTARTI